MSALSAEVADHRAAAELISGSVESPGGLDLLVNCAGGTATLATSMTLEEAAATRQKLIGANLTRSFTAQWPRSRTCPGQAGGS